MIQLTGEAKRKCLLVQRLRKNLPQAAAARVRAGMPYNSSCLPKAIATLADDRVSARLHYVIAVSAYVSVKNATIPITQNYEAVLAVAARATDKTLQQRVKIRRCLRKLDKIAYI
jgi:hypothetical protein